MTIENLLTGKKIPFECLVSHRQKNINKTCAFPSMMQHTIRNEQTEQFVFERCVPSEQISPTWWYSVDGEVLPLEFTQNYTLSNIYHIVFFYGEEDDQSNVILHNMDKLHSSDYQFSNISFLAESTNNKQRQVHLTENLQSEILNETVNTTTLTTITTSTSTRPSATITDMATTKGTHSETCIAEDKTKLWITMTAGVASALGMVIGIYFTTLYGIARKEGKTVGLQRGLTTVEGEDNEESLEMVTQSPRPDDCSLPHFTVSNQPLEEMSLNNDTQFDFLHSGCRSTASLPDTQSLVKKEGNTTSHHINNCSDANFATSEHLVKTGRIHKNSQGTHHNNKGSCKTHALSTVVGSGPSLEITYCSLDDIDDATSKILR